MYIHNVHTQTCVKNDLLCNNNFHTLCMYLCIALCMYLCTCVRMYIHIYVHTHTHTHTQTPWVHTCAHGWVGIHRKLLFTQDFIICNALRIRYLHRKLLFTGIIYIGNYYLHRKLLFTQDFIICNALPASQQSEIITDIRNYYLHRKLSFTQGNIKCAFRLRYRGLRVWVILQGFAQKEKRGSKKRFGGLGYTTGLCTERKKRGLGVQAILHRKKKSAAVDAAPVHPAIGLLLGEGGLLFFHETCVGKYCLQRKLLFTQKLGFRF